MKFMNESIEYISYSFIVSKCESKFSLDSNLEKFLP